MDEFYRRMSTERPASNKFHLGFWIYGSHLHVLRVTQGPSGNGASAGSQGEEARGGREYDLGEHVLSV